MDTIEPLSENTDYIGPLYDSFVGIADGANEFFVLTIPVPHGYIHNVKHVSIDFNVSGIAMLAEIALMQYSQILRIAAPGTIGVKFRYFPDFVFPLVEDQYLRIMGWYAAAVESAIICVYSEVYKIKS